jgi:hypothetical protein
MTDATDKLVVELSDEEKQKASALQRDIMNAKLLLADADLKVAAAELARVEHRAKASKATQDYFNALRDFAKDHNLDLSDDSKRWVFDLTKLSFIEQ